jgi:hypothetical protein
MRDMLSRTGEPSVTTTKVTPPKENLDIGMLVAMLMMSNMFKKPAGQDLSTLNAMPAGDSGASILGSLGSSAIPGLTPDYSGNPARIDSGLMAGGAGAGGGLTPELLFKILLGMGGR